ncbi:hypothetical protein F5B19DRAFT_501848 [Rostrohypoxylon terebratum]|nr:hypothetical protein F5B19DRAFT_501848 [Rostrohypoxylon terebratum]
MARLQLPALSQLALRHSRLAETGAKLFGFSTPASCCARRLMWFVQFPRIVASTPLLRWHSCKSRSPDLSGTENAATRACASHSLSPASVRFWASPSTWRRASVNTTRCLIGCTSGDFSASPVVFPGAGRGNNYDLASGLTTSMLLETVLLRLGRDGLSWSAAAKTAAGMSLISMLTMETAQNIVDYHLTGGSVAFDSPAFWVAAVISMSAGFLAPLPYNYLRLRKYGRACH